MENDAAIKMLIRFLQEVKDRGGEIKNISINYDVSTVTDEDLNVRYEHNGDFLLYIMGTIPKK